MNKSTQSKILKFGYRAGLIGAALIALGALLSALGFSGRSGESYRLLNHFVSELGEYGYSSFAWAFNGSLFIGGICLTVFLLSVAVYIGRWYGFIFGILGLITGISGALVGVFPMNDLQPHIRVATTFFNVSQLTMGWFLLIVLFAKEARLPRWLAIPALVNTLLLVAFVNLPQETRPENLDLRAATEMLLTNRPDFVLMTVLEWGVLFGVLIWSGLLSWQLGWKANNQESND